MYNSIYKKISRNCCFLLMVIWWLLSGYGAAYAQENAANGTSGFSGVVVDQYGRPVQGVEVTVKAGSYKAVSDETGTFGIDAVIGNTLVLTHPDYLIKEIKIPKDIKKGTVFKVDIKDKKLKNPSGLDVPYGKTVDKESYLGAASTIYTDEIAPALSANILGALAGRLSGLYVSQGRGYRNTFTNQSTVSNAYLGGQADDSRVGYNDNTQYGFSLRGAFSPVVVVDGFQSDLFNLDVESIESVSVQKDALSSMFLGGRSSRGVMYITTKKPIAEGFKISFTGRYGIQEPIKTPKPLPSYQWAYLLNEALVNDGKSGVYTADNIESFRYGKDPIAYPNVNWYDQVLKNNSDIQSYNLNATGGNKTAQYFVSLGYFSENGLLREDKQNAYNTNLAYERYMVTSKINVNVLPGLKMGATVIGRIEEGNQPGAGLSSVMGDIYTLPGGVYPVYNPNGSYGGSNSYQNNLMAKTIGSGYIKDIMRDGYANIAIDHDMAWLTEGLSARVVGSVVSQSRNALDRSKQEPVYLRSLNPDGSLRGYERFGSIVPQRNGFIGVSNFQYMYGQVALDYKKIINTSHTIEGNVGQTHEN